MEGLSGFIETQLERFGVPGLGLGLVRDGETVVAEGYGVRNLDDGAPVTTSTLFAIGSSTKAFTAALVGALVDDGLLSWDAPIRDYLPWFEMYDPVASNNATVRDLLCHRTGLPRHDLVWYGDPPISRAEMVARIRHLPPNRGFRELWQYNNLGYVTAGYLAGELLGSTWEDAVRKRLLDPLGMSETNFSVSESQRVADHSRPHDEHDDVLEPIPFRGIDTVGPAGSINSTIGDMLAFIHANTDGGRVGERQIISPATIREMHTAQMVRATEGSFEEVTEDAYGLGWFVGTYRGHRVVHHGGNIDGFTALMTLLPEARTGIVILTNRGQTLLPKLVAYHLFDRVLGLEPIDWPERAASLLDAMTSGLKEARQHATGGYATDTSPSHPLDAYVGEFEHPGYGTISIRLSEDGDRLLPGYNGLDLALTHRHYDVFDLSVVGRDEMKMPLIFATDAEGEIASAAVQMESSVEPLVFARRPDQQLFDPVFLEVIQGVYEMGPVRARVDRRGEDAVVLSLPMIPPSVLEPALGSRYRLKDMPGIKVEFMLDDAGAVSALIIQGMGRFTPATSE